MNEKRIGTKRIRSGRIRQFLADDTAGARLFLLAWALFLCEEALGTTMFPIPGAVYAAWKGLAVVFVLAKIIFFDRMSPEAFWAEVLVVVLSVGIVAASGYTEPVFWTVMLVGARDVPWEKILRIYLLVSVSVLLLAFCASMLDVIENLQYSVAGSLRLRNSFGIVYTTDFASHIFSALLVVFYLMRERLKVWHFAAAAVISVLVFWFCNTRVDVGCIFIMLVLFAAFALRDHRPSIRKKYRIFRFRNRVACWFMPFAAVVMFVATLCYSGSSSLMVKLDALISLRLQLGKRGLEDYGVSILGQPVEMVGFGGSEADQPDYFFVDCSYLYVFLRYGVLFLLLVLAVYVLCCKRFRKDSYFLAAIIVISINCMIAHHLVELAYNPFALALFAAVPGIRESDGANRMENRFYAGEIGKI